MTIWFYAAWLPERLRRRRHHDIILPVRGHPAEYFVCAGRALAGGLVPGLFLMLLIPNHIICKQLGWSRSGGERQMPAIGRGIMARPKILLLDDEGEVVYSAVTNR